MEKEKLINIEFVLNGKKVKAEVPHYYTLLRVVREVFGLTGTKGSCQEGECGVCTMLINDKPMTTCLMLAIQANGKRVDTVEGVTEKKLGKIISQSFIDSGSVQCGFCIPAMVVTAYSLIKSNSNMTRDEIGEGMSGVLCRCTGYQKIVDGVMLASKRYREDGEA